jgi:hypothetical protein
MTRIAIAALIALSIPAVGLADERWEHDRGRSGHDHRADGWSGAPAPAPAPARARLDDRRDLARLQVLLARYEEAISRRAVRAQRMVEAEILRALDDEIAESRHELRLVRGYEVRQARAELARLQALRAELARLAGRPGPRAVERKRELVVEATRLARRELRQDRMGGAVAWGRR